MALNVGTKSSGNGNRVEQKPVDPGVYPSRIVQLIDLGLQAQRPYKGVDKPPANEIMISYELVDEFIVDEKGVAQEDKPRWISETLPVYPIDKDKAKSTQRYLAIDPNAIHKGDFSKILNEPCNVALVHNKVGDKLYVNVASIAAMRQKDEDKCPPLKNPAKLFDLDSPDVEIFNSLPQWVQDKIKGNLNYNNSKLQAILNNKPIPKEEKEAPPNEEEQGNDNPWD